MTKQHLKTNIQKIFVFNFFMAFMMTISVIVPYWQSFGLSLQEIFQLHSIYGLCLIVLDVPAGYLADILGRKKCLILSGIFNIISFRLLYIGSSFSHFIVFEVFAALTYAFYAGSDIALLYDSYDSVEKDNHKLLGKKVFYSQIGETLAALAGGFLAGISLRLPAQVNLYTSTIPLIVAFTLIEPVKERLNHKEHAKNITFILKSLFKHSSNLNFLIMFNIVYGLGTYVAVWTYQTQWRALQIPLGYFGLLWAGSNIIMALVARKSHKFRVRIPMKIILIFIALTPILAFVGMGYSKSLYGLIFIIPIAAARGFNSVIIQNEINQRIPGKIRATANSICSLGMRGAFVFIGPMFGKLIDKEGVFYSQFYLGFIFVIPLLVIMLPLLVSGTKYRPILS